MNSNVKTREPYFDNLKGILIYLVTAGHFLLPLTEQTAIRSLFYYIYTFHMPCFVFLSGYFAKSTFANHRFQYKKVINFLWLYLLYKALVYVTEGLADGAVWGRFRLFTESGAPWYLLALVFWYLSLPIVSRLKPRIVLTAAIVIGLLCGYQYSIHYFLALNRTLVFAPFFYAGYFIKKDFHKQILSKKRQPLFIVVFLFASIFVLLNTSSSLAPYSDIVFGISYKYLRTYAAYGAVIRLLWYLLASIFLLCLLHLIPAKETFYTKAGICSLQIYILHRPIRDICQFLGLYQLPLPGPGIAILLILGGSALLVRLLSNFWLQQLFSQVVRLPEQLKTRIKGS